MTREVNLNNPCGIKRNQISWAGESTLQDDPVFVRYETPVMGLRAAMKVLLTYQRKDDIQTVPQFINRWAPPSENNTTAYIYDVLNRLKVTVSACVDLEIPDNLIKLTQAIVHHENGACPDPAVPDWYQESLYEAAAKLALT